MDTGPDDYVNVHRLARAISSTLNLPHDDSLAFVIGTGRERTSEEAVASWLRQVPRNVLHLPLDDLCNQLSLDLERRLDESA